MKQPIRLIALALSVIFALGFTACSNSKTDKTYTVGICQLNQHAALDDATQGFMDALESALPGQVKFDHQNASNEIAQCSTIVNQFIAENVDLILANATPALQAAAAATSEIPILSTSITEYSAALDVELTNGIVGGNISGTSDLTPPDEQAQMVQTWFPNAENIGLLYCSAEANSQYQIKSVQVELEQLGYVCTLYPFTDSNDLFSVVEGAAATSDVIYTPTDNTVAANATIIDNVCRPVGIPVIGGDMGICSVCGVAALCIDYYELGFATGEMAAKILTGEVEISEMPIQYTEPAHVYNEEICTVLGLTPPAGYTAINAE